MRDNNLFGDDSCPPTPAPEITEISLKDISSAVDLNEFRRQQREQLSRHKLVKENEIDEDLNLPEWLTKPSVTVPPHDNMIFEKETESQSLSRDISPGDSFISRGLLECHDSSICDRPAEDNSFYASPVTEKYTGFDLIEETIEPESERVEDTSCGLFIGDDDTHATRGDFYSQLPNGNPYRPLRLHETMDTNRCLLQRMDSNPRDLNISRRSSLPARRSGSSESRRKRTSFNEKSGSKSGYSFNIDKFTKEELLCMWKSKELELNARLSEAVRDKEKLEHKLAGKHYSTPV